MNKIKLLLIISMFFLLSGCYSYTEIHELSFVISFGFDYSDADKMYEVSAYIINNANLTQSESQTSSEHNAYIGTAKGTTISSAIEELNKNLDVILEFKHIKTVFITEEFINSQNLHYLYTFFRNGPLFYPNFEIYITTEKIKDIYKVQVFEETTIFYTLLTGQKKAHNYKVANFYDFINDYIIPNYSIGYPLIEVNKTVFENQKDPHMTLENSGIVYLDQRGKFNILKYQEYPGLYLINNFTDLLINLSDLELIINNYFFNVNLDTENPESIINVTIKSDVAYVYSDTIKDYEISKYTKKYFINEINKVFDYCYSIGIDILNINYLRSLKGLPECDIRTYQFNWTIDVLHP